MSQVIFVPKEVEAGEPRVAASPDTVKRLVGLGFEVVVEAGAGLGSRIVDEEFAKAGATIGKASDAGRADLVLKVRRPTEAELKGYKQGAVVIATMDPYGNDAAVAALARGRGDGLRHGVHAAHHAGAGRWTCCPRQANLAGYQAVIDAAAEYDRALPMMMTAAGTVPAAKVFVMGVGRRRLAGDRHRAAAWRRRYRDRCASRRQGAGRLARREIRGGRGRGVQGGRDRRRLRQGNVEGIPGEAGGAGRRAHRQAGHRHHHGAHPRPSGAEAGVGGDGCLDEAGLGDRRPGGGARRQCRRCRARRGRHDSRMA